MKTIVFLIGMLISTVALACVTTTHTTIMKDGRAVYCVCTTCEGGNTYCNCT